MKTLKDTIKFTFILLLLVNVHISVNAQIDNNDANLERLELTNPAGSLIYTTGDNTSVKGSPLYKDNFETGHVIFKNSKASDAILLNLDTYQNQIIFIKNGKKMVLSPVDVKGFFFVNSEGDGKPDKELFTLGIKSEKYEITAFTPLRLIHNGKVKMFAKHTTHLIKGNTKDPFTGKVTDRFYKDTQFFLQKEDGSIVKTKDRVKDVIKALGKEHKKPLEKYMKENDLDNKSEQDISRLLSYYESNVI